MHKARGSIKGNQHLPRAGLPYSETQIQKLSLEFRKLQKECNLNSKKTAYYDFARNGQEKMKELLQPENIGFEDYESTTERRNEEVRRGMQPHKTKINLLTRYSSYLPCYLIENEKSTINCNCWTREQEDFSNSKRAINLHLQVNCQVEDIIHTVTSVLESVNPAKLKELSSMAHSAEEVGNVLRKPENLTFISSLLHSKFIQKNRDVRTEMCSLVVARTDLIHDISKFKKNIVFRLDVPESLVNIYNRMVLPKAPVKEEAESSFDELLKIKKHVGSNISIIPGYQLLQKGSSSGGIAVIDQNGTSISYIAAGSSSTDSTSKTNLTIFMQSPKVSDHQYVMEKMSEMENDKIILARPNNKIEEACLKIAKRNMKTDMKVLQDDINHQEIKEDILKRLTNEERLAIAEKAAKMKNLMINAKGEVRSVPIVDILRGSVERHSLLKLVSEASDKEKEVMFKPTNQGGMGIGELLMDKSELSMLSRLDRIPNAKNVAVVEAEGLSRAPKKLNTGLNSLFGTLKLQQEVTKKEIGKTCGAFIRRLQRK